MNIFPGLLKLDTLPDFFSSWFNNYVNVFLRLVLIFYFYYLFSYENIHIIWFCCNWLAMSNSCYNPFVYGLLNVSIQRVIVYLILTGWWNRQTDRQTKRQTDRQSMCLRDVFGIYKQWTFLIYVWSNIGFSCLVVFIRSVILCLSVHV